MPTLLLIALLLAGPVARAEWFPVSATLDGKPGQYEALPHAAKPWRICVLLPHARDKYWWGISWGLLQEAERLGVRIGIYQAGGYEFLNVQRRQFADCLSQHADAILLGAISAEGLNGDIEAAREAGVPVIDLVNGVTSRAVAARSLVNFGDMVSAAMRYVLADARGRRIRLLWLPGPKDAGWVIDAENGLQQSLQGKAVEVLHGGYAPPDSGSQMSLIRAHMKESTPDYVLANAVASEAAANYLHYEGKRRSKVVSYYATEPVVEQIRQGKILASPSDGTILLARIAVDLAVRVLENKAHANRVSPAIEVLDGRSITRYDIRKLLAPPFQRFSQRPLPPR